MGALQISGESKPPTNLLQPYFDSVDRLIASRDHWMERALRAEAVVHEIIRNSESVRDAASEFAIIIGK